MSRLLDLDRLSTADLNALGVEQLQRIVDTLARLREHQEVEPELRATILRRVAEALSCGRITDEQAQAIRAELDEVVPSVVLQGHLEELVDLNRPALGAFPRQKPARALDLEAFYRKDPLLLAELVRAGLRFGGDIRHIVQSVLAEADRLGIDPEVADKVVLQAVREARAVAR
jgi:hypothetical protein